MRKAAELLTASQVALPADDEARLVLAQRTASILLVVGGALSLVVVPVAGVADLGDFNATGVVAPAIVALAAAPAVALLRWSWRGLYLMLLAATAVISVGVAAAGSNYPLGAVLYLWVVVVAFLFFSRRRAVTITGVVAAEYGLVVALFDGYEAPLGWWLYLVVTTVVTGVVLDWLVRRTRALAQAEHEARVAVERAHHELETLLREREALNRTLEERVARQVGELAALGDLRRFLSPQVADAVLQRGDEDLLEPHRRDIAVFFCDLRGFTAFTSEVEPEEVLTVLAEYYDCVGALLRRFDATIGPLSGDGVMAYFNDPVPCAEPALRAVELALEVQAAIGQLREQWRARGHDLACGIGVASGFATLGLIGFDGKRDYGPMGSVVNRASRLCDEARAGQVLVDGAIRRQIGESIRAVPLEDMTLKGFHRPVPVFVVEGAA